MQKKLLMAVDLGTSFIKAGIYDTQSRCIAGASEPVKDERPAPGMFIQHGDDLYQSVLRCMRQAVESLEEDDRKAVQAIAFTGQMAGFMGVDENWNDVTTWSCSVDTRYIPYADRQMEKYADDFLEICGTNAPQTAPKYAWFSSEFPEETKRIAKYVMISGYVIGRLGKLPIENAVIDGSFIAWSGMADIRKREWSQELCQKIGMDPKYMPRIVESSEICGYLDEEAARETGLPSGIPLVSGAGDKVAGNVGACILNPGDMIFEAGSYGGYSCLVEEYRPDREAHYFDGIAGPEAGTWYAHKYIPGSGITLDWFVDTFMDGNGRSKKERFGEIEKLAAAVAPGSEGVMAIGLLGGSSMPYDGSLRGMWMGHTWSHHKGHFYRSLLESYSYDLGITIDRVEAMYPEYQTKELKVIGGGAKSALWMQMLADVTGKKIRRLDREDIALWGAAILAGCGVGIFPDRRGIAEKYVGIREEFEPDGKVYDTYQAHKAVYRDFVKELHQFYQRLV